MARKKFDLAYLPLLVLLTVFVFKIFLFLYFPFNFDSDETIVHTISGQNLTELFNTIQAEPHPPGIYLFLKLFSFQERHELRLLAIVTSFILLLGALLYAKHTEILGENKLSLGLSLFFSTAGFISIFTNVKQDFISFPLLLTLFFVAINLINRKTPEFRYFVWLHLLLILLLFIGYAAYFQGLLLVFILSMYYYKYKGPKYLFIAQLLILLGYFILFGATQISNNISRFNWVGEFDSSFVRSIPQFLLGMDFTNFWSDLIVIVFAVFAIKGIIGKSWDRMSKIILVTIAMILVLVLLAYMANGFVRPRYVSFLFLLLSLIWGWEIGSLIRKYPKISKSVYVYIFIVLSFNIFFSASRDITQAQRVDELNQVLLSNVKEEKANFIIEHPTAPFVYKFENKLGENIIPMNLFAPQITESDFVNKKFLLMDGMYEEIDVEEIKDRLKKNEVIRYIYLFSFRGNNVNFDPDHSVFRVLVESCEAKIINVPDPSSIFYLFEDCDFNSNSLQTMNS